MRSLVHGPHQLQLTFSRRLFASRNAQQRFQKVKIILKKSIASQIRLLVPAQLTNSWLRTWWEFVFHWLPRILLLSLSIISKWLSKFTFPARSLDSSTICKLATTWSSSVSFWASSFAQSTLSWWACSQRWCHGFASSSFKLVSLLPHLHHFS